MRNSSKPPLHHKKIAPENGKRVSRLKIKFVPALPF